MEEQETKTKKQPATAKTFVSLGRGKNGQLQVEQAQIDSNGKLVSVTSAFTDVSGHLVVEEFKTICGRMIMGATQSE